MLRSPALLAILSLVGSSCATADDTRLQGCLDLMLAEAEGGAVQVSVMVVDLADGGTVYQRRPRLLGHPASTMKLLTTAAICRRAPMWWTETRLETDGLPVGRLVLQGGGDPFLSRADLARMVDELKSRGLAKAESLR